MNDIVIALQEEHKRERVIGDHVFLDGGTVTHRAFSRVKAKLSHNTGDADYTPVQDSRVRRLACPLFVDNGLVGCAPVAIEAILATPVGRDQDF